MRILWNYRPCFGLGHLYEGFGFLAGMNKKAYIFLMKVGRAAGCHQMPERSFFYKGYQFPVCARCTGVIIGQILGAISFFLLVLPNRTVGFLCFMMFLDWWLQRVGLLQSTNLRRLITGLLCGFAVGNTYVRIVCWLWRLLCK